MNPATLAASPSRRLPEEPDPHLALLHLEARIAVQGHAAHVRHLALLRQIAEAPVREPVAFPLFGRLAPSLDLERDFGFTQLFLQILEIARDSQDLVLSAHHLDAGTQVVRHNSGGPGVWGGS